MSLEELLTILPPPEHPVEPGDATQWRQFEAATGLIFPPDYHAFINTYGTGHIEETIFPHNPFCQRRGLRAYYNYAQWAQEATAIQATKRRGGDEWFPFPVYPEAGGLLPWGSTSNGDRLLWRTAQRLEEWSVVVNETRSTNFEVFACSVTAFIYGLLTGSIASDIIPPDAFASDTVFAPY